MSTASTVTRRVTGSSTVAAVAVTAAALAVLLAACSGNADSAGENGTDGAGAESRTTAPTVESAPADEGELDTDSNPEDGDADDTTATTATPATSGELATVATIAPSDLVVEAYPVPSGSRPHDVAPAADGGVWYTAQNLGELGWLDPDTGETRHLDLGDGSRPHGVIVDDDGTAWITDGGLNAIVAVDPTTDEVTVHPLPADRPNANLNTATFDGDGILWFTGQNGIYGSLDPRTGEMVVNDAPRGRGPYGITTTPDGVVYLASLAGSYVGRIDPGADGTGEVAVLEPPTAEQGARRVWSDSDGSIWVSEWNSGNLSRYTPSPAGLGEWDTWALPVSPDGGEAASTYAVYVDEHDIVWTSDFTANALVRFDPATEEFTRIPLANDPGDVRQILGRAGEVWGAESASDHLVVVRTVER